jgi:hypothetical protein
MKMTPKEEAKIYRRAAEIVAGMDPRRSWILPPGISGSVGRQYSQTEAAIWDGYAGAAAVLYRIADTLEKESSQPDAPRG